jgi:hypothetical protein
MPLYATRLHVCFRGDLAVFGGREVGETGGSGRVIQPSSSPESSDEESDGKPEQPVHDESSPGAWVRQPTVQHPLEEPADYRVQALNPALGVVASPHTGGLRVCLRRVGQEHTE